MPASAIEYKVIDGYSIPIEMYRGYDIYDGIVGKRLAFIKNNYLVVILLTYFFKGPEPGVYSLDVPNSDVRPEDRENIKVRLRDLNKKYFEEAKKRNIELGLGHYDSFYYYLEQDFREGKLANLLPVEVQNLILKFDELINSLKIE